MAHYLEHMLFMGSSQYPEPDGFMAFTAEHGGMTNAYTGLDITNYMMRVENEAFPEALDPVFKFFTDPLLDPTYIDKEKNAVNAEWSMRREQDFRITYRLSESFWAIIRPIDFRLATWSRWPTKLRVGCTMPLWRFSNNTTAPT